MTGSDVLAIVLGAVLALALALWDRQVGVRRRRAALQAHRQAMATEAAVLTTLDPESPGAQRLRQVVEARVDAYVGVAPARPRLRRAVVLAGALGAVAAYDVVLVLEAATALERFGPLFLATATGSLSALAVRGIVRTRHVLARQELAAQRSRELP